MTDIKTGTRIGADERRRALPASWLRTPGDAFVADPTDSDVAAPLGEASRVRLGAAPDTPAEVLRGLARDRSVTVRAAVAMNLAAPALADAHLAADDDERVRTLLARKMAQLIPGVPQERRGALEEHALSTLARLVEDEAVRVRAAIAEAVKEMPHAPRELILRLAHDSAVAVSEPVIRVSPLLTPNDLLSLLETPPHAQAATAVAQRPGLPEAVSDVIAAGADTQAITALLSNRSAAIREATLDALVARAADEKAWHDKLVRRPALSARAARALSEIVTSQLLSVLAARGDLTPEVTRELQRRLSARNPAPPPRAKPSLDEEMARAHAMLADDRLDETALTAAAERGELQTCTALLAVAARIPVAVVERAVTLRSAKAVVSLVWQAGFSMRAATVLQMLLCHIDPVAALRGPAGGGFPLAVDEMRWQLEFLQRMGR